MAIQLTDRQLAEAAYCDLATIAAAWEEVAERSGSATARSEYHKALAKANSALKALESL